jgi:hypothetical protein
LDGIGFLVQGQYIHGVWTSWMAYTGGAQPFSVANFVNNSPMNTINPVAPNAGSIDPFREGQPMLGTPRNFTLLFKPAGYTGAMAASLAGVPAASINPANIKDYPTIGHGNTGSFWILANRNYAAFPGYNPGGTTKSTFPTTTAVNLATGRPVDCQKYNQIPDRLQRLPTNPPNSLNHGTIPIRFALKNGTSFKFIGGLGGGGGSQFPPPNPKGQIVFTRPPIGPGADVPVVPPTQSCAGYLGTASSTTQVELIRTPHIANYTNNEGVTSSTLYPNPVNPRKPWEASYESYVQYGTSSGLYLPGNPNTTTVADAEFKPDSTDGSTILSWPRSMSRGDQRRVFRYANSQGWAIVRSGTAGRQTKANVLIRIKGSASNYTGNISGVPCFYGTPSNPQNTGAKWSTVPVGPGSPYVASIANMYVDTPAGRVSAAPQGVTCRSVRDLTSGRCLASLKSHLKATGASYNAP